MMIMTLLAIWNASSGLLFGGDSYLLLPVPVVTS